MWLHTERAQTDLMFALRVVENYPVTRRVALHPCGSRKKRILVRCVVGVTDGLIVGVGLHEGSALSPFLFVVVMDRLTDEVRQEGCLQTT